MAESEPCLLTAITDLYLDVKVRNSQEADSLSDEQVMEERERLLDTDPFTVLDYIKSSFDILMSMKVAETRTRIPASDQEDLEKMLQKLEGDVRQHIRVEQQLKLHIESIQEKQEEDEKSEGAEETKTESQ